MVFDDTRRHGARRPASLWNSARIESCGKCTPCRIGSTRGVEMIDKILAGGERGANLALLEDLCETMKVRLALRARRLHPLSGVERARPFPRRFRSRAHAVAAE